MKGQRHTECIIQGHSVLKNQCTLNLMTKPGSETPDQDESFTDIQVAEDNSEPDQKAESEDSPEAQPTSEAEPTLEAQNQNASDEAQDGSQLAIQSKNTFKYKSSHPEYQIIGNKDSLRRTRSYFKQEESMIGLLSVMDGY
ncbi:hypothetical protein MTR_0080s0090 [Medicago truncatula]|uniref:Uncharacterized protein n=1 Tax=Medicago truncatula TaxID=3880 RepID=A0A072TI51_MEDTR|nr:hypothetical protein MTR_0080s0090 [Medicago truncatula]